MLYPDRLNAPAGLFGVEELLAGGDAVCSLTGVTLQNCVAAYLTYSALYEKRTKLGTLIE